MVQNVGVRRGGLGVGGGCAVKERTWMLAGKITRTRPGSRRGNLPMKSSLRGICSEYPGVSEQVSILRDLFLRGTKRIRGISSCRRDRG